MARRFNNHGNEKTLENRGENEDLWFEIILNLTKENKKNRKSSPRKKSQRGASKSLKEHLDETTDALFYGNETGLDVDGIRGNETETMDGIESAALYINDADGWGEHEDTSSLFENEQDDGKEPGEGNDADHTWSDRKDDTLRDTNKAMMGDEDDAGQSGGEEATYDEFYEDEFPKVSVKIETPTRDTSQDTPEATETEDADPSTAMNLTWKIENPEQDGENNGDDGEETLVPSVAKKRGRKPGTKKVSALGCHLCRRKFKSNADLRIHVQTVHINQNRNNGDSDNRGTATTQQKEIHKCRECGEEFPFEKPLKAHMESVHNYSPSQCAKCGKLFGSKEKVRKHKIWCSREKIMCDICGKLCKGKHIERHMKLHDGIEKRWKCNECGERFMKELQRRKHKQEAHGNCPTCNVCGKTFYYKTKYALHMIREHGQETEFTCDVCGKGFPIKSKLLRHRNEVHEGLKPYQCSTCGKKFVSQYHLARHEVEIHIKGDVKNFFCDLCGKGFKRAGSLKSHKELHQEERRFKCHICGKSYNIRRGLMVHLMAHDDVRNYHCEVCGKSYRTNSSLKQHIASHTKEKTGVDMTQLI